MTASDERDAAGHGSGAAGDAIQVFLYGDYVCPFSYVADARLRRLQSTTGGFDLRWRPLSIHPAVPSDGLPVEELGYAPEEWARVRREVREQADEADLELDLPDFVANSHEALQAGEFARDVGLEPFRRVHRALFRAYFVEGRNLGRREVLLDVCADAGIDRQALETALEDDRYGDELRRAEEEASRYDIEGTPTILFGRHKVVGAAPEDVMEEALGRALEEAAPTEEAEERAGEGGGPEGG